MSIGGQDPDVAALMAKVEAFISSNDGVEALHRVMRRNGIAAHFDSYLVEQTSISLRRRFERGNTEVVSVEGLVVTTMGSRAKDLLRNPRSARARARRTTDEGDVVDVGMEDYEELTVDHADGVVAALAVAQLRHRILRADVEAWVASAALTLIAASSDGVAVGDQCPRPVGGASVDEAHRWAALWYAGRRRCFDHEGASPEATRKCRSRDVKVLREFISEVATQEGWRDGA